MSFTKVTNTGIGSTGTVLLQNLDVTGIVTAGFGVSTVDVFTTGITTFANATDSTSTTTGSVIVSGGVGIAGSLNVGGSVSVGGTLTYEDVTNVDSVGIITARSNILVGSGITLSPDGDVFATGISTFTGLVDANGGAHIDNLRLGIDADNDITTSSGNLTLDSAGGNVVINDNLDVDGTTTIDGDLSIADKIVHTGDINTAIRFPENDHISFEATGSEAMRIDDGGKLLIGLTTRRLFASGHTSQVQIEGLDSLIQSSLSIVNNQASTGSPNIRLGKTRGTSIGSNTSVADGDNLGQIIFYGADGTDIYNATALIGAKVNGTVGTDTIPTDLIFSTSATTGSGRNERVRITSGGRLLINSTVARNISTNINRMLQIESSGGGAGLAIARNSDNASGPSIDLGKSRGYANTIVQSGDMLGQIRFAGADGTNLESPAAQIKVEVDGTPGENDMPGRLILSTTADGAASPTERLRIDSSGHVTKPTQFHIVVTRSGNQTGYNPSQGFGTGITYNFVEITQGTTSSALNTSNGRVTVPVAGIYFLEASGYSDQAVFTQGWFTKNGSRLSFSDFMNNSGNSQNVNSVGFHKLAANDTIGYKAYGSGSTSTTIVATSNHTWMRITLVG